MYESDSLPRAISCTTGNLLHIMLSFGWADSSPPPLPPVECTRIQYYSVKCRPPQTALWGDPRLRFEHGRGDSEAGTTNTRLPPLLTDHCTSLLRYQSRLDYPTSPDWTTLPVPTELRYQCQLDYTTSPDWTTLPVPTKKNCANHSTLCMTENNLATVL